MKFHMFAWDTFSNMRTQFRHTTVLPHAENGWAMQNFWRTPLPTQCEHECNNHKLKKPTIHVQYYWQLLWGTLASYWLCRCGLDWEQCSINGTDRSILSLHQFISERFEIYWYNDNKLKYSRLYFLYACNLSIYCACSLHTAIYCSCIRDVTVYWTLSTVLNESVQRA